MESIKLFYSLWCRDVDALQPTGQYLNRNLLVWQDQVDAHQYSQMSSPESTPEHYIRPKDKMPHTKNIFLDVKYQYPGKPETVGTCGYHKKKTWDQNKEHFLNMYFNFLSHTHLLTSSVWTERCCHLMVWVPAKAPWVLFVRPTEVAAELWTMVSRVEIGGPRPAWSTAFWIWGSKPQWVLVPIWGLKPTTFCSLFEIRLFGSSLRYRRKRPRFQMFTCFSEKCIMFEDAIFFFKSVEEVWCPMFYWFPFATHDWCASKVGIPTFQALRSAMLLWQDGADFWGSWGPKAAETNENNCQRWWKLLQAHVQRPHGHWKGVFFLKAIAKSFYFLIPGFWMLRWAFRCDPARMKQIDYKRITMEEDHNKRPSSTESE